ncbi:MAG: hypothetical protein NZ583_04100 [Desulfobacterota bacterium]|nr:hypothetical protein [Thermodesulfobacteriota bacterium]MDW8001549.1 hypothetical protein [Deltaproteobacteria bacterium]
MEIGEKEIRLLRKRMELELLKKEAEIIEFWKKDLERIHKKTLDPKLGMGDIEYDLKNVIERMATRLGVLNRMIKELA